MVFILCLWMRHLVGLLFVEHLSDPIWNQAGSCAFRCGLRHMALKLILYILAAFSICVVFSSSFAFLALFVGGFRTVGSSSFRSGFWFLGASMHLL